MAVNVEEVFKEIKKHNGERFAKVMRGDQEAVPEGYLRVNLLETPNLVHLLQYAGKDPKDALNLILIIKEMLDKSQEYPEVKISEKMDPLELLDAAGYKAWYVNDPDNKDKTRDFMIRDQNSIAGYFRDQRAVSENMTGGNSRSNMNELICTIYTSWNSGTDGPQRFDGNYIINAVRKEAWGDDKLPESEWHIKPSATPKREDDYGKSVISIQIPKRSGAISIKNRYNHTLKTESPDATFNNNPDNIILGLTDALKRKFKVSFSVVNAKIPSNYLLVNNQLIHFNYEVDNIYFDERYYLDGSDLTELKPEYEEMLDTVILDTRTGEIKSFRENDQLTYVLKAEIYGHKVKRTKDKSTGETVISILDENKNEKELLRTKKGCITALHLYKIRELSDYFLLQNKTLRKFEADNLEFIGESCFESNEKLQEFNVPRLKRMGDRCARLNTDIEKLNIPELESMGESCFRNAKHLKEFKAPKLKTMGEDCFSQDSALEKINIPKLETMSQSCFALSESLREFSAPVLTSLGPRCFRTNKTLERIYIPNLKKMGTNCFESDETLKFLNAPNLELMGSNCFSRNSVLTKIDLPKLKHLFSGCFSYTSLLKEFNAPELEILGSECFIHSDNLEKLYIPKLKTMGSGCFQQANKLKDFYAPCLQEMGNDCFQFNKNIEKIQIPELEKMGYNCFQKNLNLKEFNAPKLKTMESGCLHDNRIIEKIYIPNLEKMDNSCFCFNESLKELNAPKLKILGGDCFQFNEILEKIYIPELTIMRNYCFESNQNLTEFFAPKLETMEECCFRKNQVIKKIYIPELTGMGYACFERNNALHELCAEKLEYMNPNCFNENTVLEKLDTPLLMNLGKKCFENNKSLKELNAQQLQDADKHNFIKRFLRIKNLKQGVQKLLYQMAQLKYLLKQEPQKPEPQRDTY